LNGSRSRSTGILRARRRLEAKIGARLVNEGRSKVLGGKSRVEMSEQNLVDVRGAYARMLKRLACRFDDQALDGFCVELSEWRMSPPDDRDVRDLTLSWLAKWGAVSISRSSRFKTLP
jgi:hypothetical protein